jgi:hypothetical protein
VISVQGGWRPCFVDWSISHTGHMAVLICWSLDAENRAHKLKNGYFIAGTQFAHGSTSKYATVPPTTNLSHDHPVMARPSTANTPTRNLPPPHYHLDSPFHSIHVAPPIPPLSYWIPDTPSPLTITSPASPISHQPISTSAKCIFISVY